MRTWIIGIALLAAGPVQAQTEPAKPEPNPAIEAEKPAPALQVVEPKVPRMAKPKAKRAAKKSAAKAQAGTGAKPAPRAVVAPRVPAGGEVLKPSGPCVVKPVMSDQDLVNCGATPR